VLPTTDHTFVRALSVALAALALQQAGGGGGAAPPPAPPAPGATPRSAHGGLLAYNPVVGGLAGHEFDPGAPYELRALEVGLAAVVKEMDR
jgi:hypothetical protein